MSFVEDDVMPLVLQERVELHANLSVGRDQYMPRAPLRRLVYDLAQLP